MKQYLQNPYLWSILPVICAVTYNLEVGLMLIYAFLFPVLWIVAGFQTYKPDEGTKKTLLRLHIPILLCLVPAIVCAVCLDMDMRFIEETNNVITEISGAIVQKAFLPMLLAGSIVPVPRNHVLFFPVFYMSATVMMFVLSYIGMVFKKWELL